jgi:outer membrane lipoprotein-sorting protein
MKIPTIILSILVAVFGIMSIQAGEKVLTGGEILSKLDQTTSAAKDQTATIKLILIDKDGSERLRELKMYQKDGDKRLVKFLSPADQRGIGVLSLPGNVMTLYLPAFKKTRNIASHVKNSKFAGTDFTYEDMEITKYSEKYNAGSLKMEGDQYVLELMPKPGIKTDAVRLVVWIRPDIFYCTKMEYYNKSNKLYKVMKAQNIEKVKGYWIAKEMEIEDINSQHRSKMIFLESEFDTGLQDSVFTERFLIK